MAVQPQGCVPAPYRPRRPADTPLYRTVQYHLETFLALCCDDWEEERVSPHAERELRRFLECGILAYGFARARCDVPSSNTCAPPALGQAQRREPARWPSSTDSAHR